ncbi:type III PLP-dependent enzyme [Streptomyces sp. PTM05]|uniref:Type III PLP-dependent enzyme n=1 Tax=Streptantibioticus parmotrematis TaxID=2873249 RepID=A0ABS7QLP5_9ACTN|nr:type III PLP-dependent enzyme [Streptantibioticus parmotrematis]MBY8884098.1 type III PLP-dependent enzyme [Streptantibioticus parmotrematis]
MHSSVRDLVTSASAAELPAYVYDLSTLRDHAAAVRAALPPAVELYYAAKANPAPEILTALREAVTGYEVASGGELAHVREAVPGAPVAFGGPGKTPDEIAAALAAGTERFHVESVHELRLLAALAARTGRHARVLLRVNPPVDGGAPDGVASALEGVALAMGGRPTPFGLDPDAVAECLRLLREPDFGNLALCGIHAHLASGLDAEAQLALARRIVAYAAGLLATHPVPDAEVNLGGGMAVDYADPERRFDWTAFGTGLAEIAREKPELTLRIEPGRALTAYCGWYATEVLDVKHSHGEDFAVLRGGTHHLRTPVTRGHDQPFALLPVEAWPHPWPRPATGGGRITLVGQLCTPKDVFARRVPATGLRAGDRVAFAMAGAYAWNISHHEFLMHPRPRFHYVG